MKYGFVYLVLLALAPFSRVMEARYRILEDGIPAAEEARRELSQIQEFVGDSPRLSAIWRF
jgi:F0F1-type ATP synthase membrane subunit b/b'